MRMHKLFGKRGFAVFTSLALCVSLVSPSFAATFGDLQNAFNGKGDYEGITVTDNEDGSRTITLEENVTRTGNEGFVGVHKNHGNVTLDLNGHTIDGNSAEGKTGEVFNMDGGNLIIQDNSAEQTGAITGGNNKDGNGGGIVVNGGSLTIEGGAIKGNTAGVSGGGVYVSGNGSFEMTGGEISGNTANATGGGGVYVTGGGSFTMTDGTIKDNTSAMSGGGVGLNGEGVTFTMNGGEISGNTAKNTNGTAGGGGGGVWVREGASFEMTDGLITGNTVNGANGNSGGVAVHRGSFTMEGGTISGNTASNGSGVFVSSGGNHKGSFTMSDGTIDEVTTVADDDSDIEVAITGGTVSSLNEKYLDDGHGLLPNDKGTYDIVEHGDDNHHFVNGACQVVGCDAVLPVEPDAPVVDTPDEPEVEIEIDEPAVPLAAGPVTRGEFIDYLWRHEGEPEGEPATFADVPADHEYAPAIGWAQSIGIISGDIFEPDELVTVGVAREILANFAAYSDMVMPVLTTLVGDEDEAVLNCDEVLAEFFGEELAE